MALPTMTAAVLLVVAAPAGAVLAIPSAEGVCSYTPGAWGAVPAGGNAGALLHANFDDVFGDQLVVGNLVFADAQDVTDALPYGGQGGAFKSHAVALAINIAFGDALLLNGTVSDVQATSLNLTLNGKNATQILAMAEAILLSDADIRNDEYGDLVGVMTQFNQGDLGCHLPPACPTPVVARANDDGSIDLAWGPVLGAEEYRIYRAVGEGEFLFLDSSTDTLFTDETTAVGQTYRYIVTAFDGTLESRGCPAVTAASVPFFPTVASLALATAGSVALVAYFARRR